MECAHRSKNEMKLQRDRLSQERVVLTQEPSTIRESVHGHSRRESKEAKAALARRNSEILAKTLKDDREVL